MLPFETLNAGQHVDKQINMKRAVRRCAAGLGVLTPTWKSRSWRKETGSVLEARETGKKG